jgi:hypothetical protein
MAVRGTSRLARVGLGVVSLALWTVLATTPAHAESCSGASHVATLGSGSASPGSATTGTVITFSVVYASNAGCPPVVTVTISGVGTYTMSPAGSDYLAGVPFFVSAALPTGSHGYSFNATSGSGQGAQSVTLTSVSPTAVTIVAPAPIVVPPPPPPTETPAPTAAPSDAASPAPTAESTAVPSSPVSPGMGGWGERRAPAPGQPIPPSGPMPAEATLGELPGLVAWLTATAGGLALFIFLTRRAPQIEGPILEMASVSSRPSSTSAPAPYRPTLRIGDEGQMARWLRPSVQAARHVDPGHSRPADD